MKHDRPSVTARIVAAAAVVAHRRAIDPTPPAECVDLIRRMFGTTFIDRTFFRSLDSRLGRTLWRIVEWLVLPGFVQHVARRKAWIERACRRAISDGFKKVIVIGAGLDTLGARIAADRADVEVIELDHPATQRIKESALTGVPGNKPRLVSIDLSNQGVAEVLGGAASSAVNGPALVIVEGVLMYLTAERVEQLLGEICSLGSGRVRLAFTYMETSPEQAVGFGQYKSLLGVLLRAVREPFRWGATREQLGELLNRHNLRMLDIADGQDLAQEWPGEQVIGEVLGLAELDPEGTDCADGRALPCT